MLISFENCTAVPFGKHLVCTDIALICKKMFRKLSVSLLRDMLVLLYENVVLHSVFFLFGRYVFKYRFCAGRKMVYLLIHDIKINSLSQFEI